MASSPAGELTKHSANTLRQFIGRVARTGLAPFGVAQFEDDAFLAKMCGKADDQEAACMQATAVALLAAPPAEAPAEATAPPLQPSASIGGASDAAEAAAVAAWVWASRPLSRSLTNGRCRCPLQYADASAPAWPS